MVVEIILGSYKKWWLGVQKNLTTCRGGQGMLLWEAVSSLHPPETLLEMLFHTRRLGGKLEGVSDSLGDKRWFTSIFSKVKIWREITEALLTRVGVGREELERLLLSSEITVDEYLSYACN